MYTLGIDTSNYATSLAVFDTAAEEVVCDRKRFLPVKPGELGLRQSDAVFHHTAALPELLRELAAQADLSGYRTEVHGLKSAAANIGAMEVSNLARAQENAAAQGDREFISRQFPELLAAHQALLERIGAFLEQRRQAQPQAEKLPALSPQELREQVEAALHELEDFRSQECARMVEELLSRDLPPAAERALREIQGQLKLFEDDNAEALLAKLIDALDKEAG